MRNSIVVAFALLVCCAAQAGGACREVIVSNESSGDIAIVDARILRVVATIPVGKRPRGMALSPDRERLYVALGGAASPARDEPADGVGVIDMTSRRVVKIIRGVSDPQRLAVSKDGRRLFVASEDQGLVVMLDANSGAVLARTPVGAQVGGIDLSRGGMQVYATSETEGTIAVLDSRSATLLARVSAGLGPRSTSFSPDGLRAYVPNEAGGNVSVIDTAALRRLRNISLPDGLVPMRVAVPPAGKPIYVSTGGAHGILAMDPGSGRVVARADSGSRSTDLAMSPDGEELYAVNGPSNDLSVFALPKLKLRSTIHTGGKPWGVVCRDAWWAREEIEAPTWGTQ